jgi:hypothetical protein
MRVHCTPVSVGGDINVEYKKVTNRTQRYTHADSFYVHNDGFFSTNSVPEQNVLHFSCPKREVCI